VNTGKLAGMAKRGYSREFTPRTERRIKREIDKVPPTLDERVQAKCKRDGISLRALTLTLWRMWADGAIDTSAAKAAD
jgi:hypothetical protein